MTLDSLPQIGLLNPHTAFSLGYNCMASPWPACSGGGNGSRKPGISVTDDGNIGGDRASLSGAGAAFSRHSDSACTRSGMRDRDSAPHTGT